MHRLFVGLRPPPAIRDALMDIQQGIENARWQDDEQLHLTLRFCGEMSAERADDLALALQRIDAVPFTLTLAGSGHFERKGMPSAVWVGAQPSEPLLRLHRQVEHACRSAGLEAEARKFVPHVTTARLNRSSGPAASWLAANATLEMPPWDVEHFTLFESHLSPEGSRYEEILRISLR
ncbi:RNA 2',3'-cyclic phosphodiesterase [Paraurantiacibacter namhicola]|uniref:RNA 2',3'-cyclic phosphodiesterase n=1 Tax=Paraurantiacibacter namhicola TaxID=645517 RepID=A0A1C7D894_9SPHN|nr:RNA 2',3'-cyclic phosphodiesterase [Paraurantiacibacter namhicola]ANU07667.1 2'-5'-RNA ligase [Paraurantiacibacter namhicola]